LFFKFVPLVGDEISYIYAEGYPLARGGRIPRSAGVTVE
jgi:hypothetical protein